MINRILLIDIDIFRDETNSGTAVHYSHHPVGLLYLVSAVRNVFPEIGFQVYHTPTSHDPMKEIESLLSSFNPDLVGLRSLSFAKENFKKVAEKIRQLRPDVTLVGGGPYPSSSYNDILSAGLVDIAVIGEGENTFVDLIGRLRESPAIPDDVKGTAVMSDGLVKLNEARQLIQNIDEIPFPDYNFIDLKDYVGIENHALQETSKSAFILSSRGCPYGCFYCHQLFGKKIRHRSVEKVVAEMREHYDQRGIRDFVFLDDMFNVPMAEAKKLLTAIKAELPQVRINFPNGLRADQIDEEMLDLFEGAGTVFMALAVESAIPRLQKIIGKNLNLEAARKAIDEASKRFVTRVFYIIGFPTETYEEATETIDYAASFEYVAQPVLSVLRLYNNSRLFNMLQPTEAQALAIAEQEKKVIHLEMFDNIEFYGDLFPAEKVPLKSADLKELLFYWMRNVLINQNRILKSHEVLVRHLDEKRILEFYSNVFDRPKFNESDLQKLLKF